MKESIFDLAIFDQSFEELAKKLYPEIGTDLENKEGADSRHMAELKETLTGFLEDIVEGAGHFEEFASPACKEKLQRLLNGDAADDLVEMFLLGRFDMGVALGINREEIEEMYQIARSHAGETDLARKLFSALIFLNFTDVRFWIDLASCFAKNKEDSKARKVYEYACSIGFNDLSLASTMPNTSRCKRILCRHYNRRGDTARLH